MKIYLPIIGAILLSFLITQSAEAALLIKNYPVSWGYETPKKSRAIDTIVIHSIYNPRVRDRFAVKNAVALLKEYGVSAHYIIGRDGIIYNLVPEKSIAYHAGKGLLPQERKAMKEKGRISERNMNLSSIGIELINAEKTSPTNAQYKSLAGLVKELKKKYSIKNIVGHGDIAAPRKTDPWNFDWKKFNELDK